MSDLYFIILDMWVNCQHVHFHICVQAYIVLLENTAIVVVSGCRPLARGLRLQYILVCTYTLTDIRQTFSTRYIIGVAVRRTVQDIANCSGHSKLFRT